MQERQAIRLDDAALGSELLRMTDAYTDELFPLTPVEGARLVFPVSRLVCDVEQFPTDENEPMAARGMGTIYKVGRAANEAPGLTQGKRGPGIATPGKARPGALRAPLTWIADRFKRIGEATPHDLGAAGVGSSLIMPLGVVTMSLAPPAATRAGKSAVLVPR